MESLMQVLKPIEINPETFLYEHCTLPSLPDVLINIQKAMQSPGMSMETMANMIRNDPALVAQILKVVNSAYYGLPITVSDVKLGLAYLGINEVYRIVLSLSVINTLVGSDKDEFMEIWSHSLFTAFCAKHLARKYKPQLNTENLWTAALLHDIGKLVYLKFFPEHYRALKKYTVDNQGLFAEAEQHYNFPTANYLGSLLCDRWRLPELIKLACQKHRLEDLEALRGEGEKETLLRLVVLGNLFSIVANQPLREDLRRTIITAISRTLNLSAENEFMSILGEIVALKDEVNKLSF